MRDASACAGWSSYAHLSTSMTCTLLKTTESRRKSRYASRWQVETGNSMMKRNQGDALAGKSPASRKRDMRLRVLTHNIMIL